MNNCRVLIVILMMQTLLACQDNSDIKTGVFIDSPVVGIEFVTNTQSGITNLKGEYKYYEGESIIFSVGDIKLPAVKASKLITPLTIAGSSETEDQLVVNISRFLQSVDSDGDPSNNISIDEKTRKFGKGISIDFESENDTAFEASAYDFLALVKPTVGLVSRKSAVAHFDKTLDSISRQRVKVLIESDEYSFRIFDETFGQTVRSTGFGPRLDTASYSNWSDDKPRLDLSLLFGGFPNSGEIEKGTYIDLSNYDSTIIVELTFSASKKVAGKEVHAVYGVTVGEGSSKWISGSSGSIAITEFQSKEDAIGIWDFEMDILLKDVLLKKISSNENPSDMTWPNEVFISVAQFCNLTGGCEK